jgi:hypothetical protein
MFVQTTIGDLSMPAYKAKFATKTPIELEFALVDGSPVGALKIKPSTLLWKGHRSKRYRSVSIERLGELMHKHGKPVKF